MPPSDNAPTQTESALPPDGKSLDPGATGVGLAVAAEALYLTNLLAIPGLGFVLLALLAWRRRPDAAPLAVAHLDQTLYASLWAGLLLVIVVGLILLLGDHRGVLTWTLIILYFTVCHATLVLFGVYGLAKAMAGQCWRFPLVGRPLPRGCTRADQGADQGADRLD